MDTKTKEFLQTHFKQGEFVQLTILVKLTELKAFTEHIAKAKLNLAVMPHVEAEISYQTEDDSGGVVN